MVMYCTSCLIPSRDSAVLNGRQRRRIFEYERIEKKFADTKDVSVEVKECDSDGIPKSYLVTFFLRSICGVDENSHPVFSDRFEMEVIIPEKYPQADAPVMFRFTGKIRPWHPNIVYYGDTAGTVCVNPLNTYADIAWCIDRVESYLKYDLYHAELLAPFPVDLKVAEWVRLKGEPCGWIFFDQVE